VRILDITSGKESVQETNDPLGTVRTEVKKSQVQFDRFRLTGGAVGYISYDAVRYFEKLPQTTLDDQEYPDIEMALFDDGLVFDHINKEAYYYHQSASRLKELEELIQNDAAQPEPLRYTPPEPNPPEEQFKESVTKAKEYVSSGDVFQAVLSKRYSFKLTGSLLPFYKALRTINPSPYMYFLKMGERRIVGSSPESLFRVDHGNLETYPIAGTRPRNDDPAKNQALAEELLSDPKERAEHVMLVDLARNDLGRVAEFASVKVPEFMTVHQYSHVQHIVSKVVGTMRSDKDAFDVLKVMLPAGTVSGAPKVRAMEIIEELEPTRRGPYAGAVGYFSNNGNADFAITIRTLTTNHDRASIQVGAGIVADSDPEREWFETDHKGAALMKALAMAGEQV
jgi:anthranilate synthase component I